MKKKVWNGKIIIYYIFSRYQVLKTPANDRWERSKSVRWGGHLLRGSLGGYQHLTSTARPQTRHISPHTVGKALDFFLPFYKLETGSFSIHYNDIWIRHRTAHAVTAGRPGWWPCPAGLAKAAFLRDHNFSVWLWISDGQISCQKCIFLQKTQNSSC